MRALATLAVAIACLVASASGEAATPQTFIVTTAADSGAGSLRQAITDANATSTADIVTFAIGSGTQTITLASALPPLAKPLSIDGTTQPGYAATPLIVLDGATGAFTGIDDQAGRSHLAALVIENFSVGVVLHSHSGGTTLDNSYVGVAANGSPEPNGIGVQVRASKANTIIDSSVAGNLGAGIEIAERAASTTVKDTRIGLAPDGTTAVANGTGLVIDNASNSFIYACRIAGNTGNGVTIRAHDKGKASGNSFVFTSVGVAGQSSGALIRPNGALGIEIDDAGRNYIAETTISGNTTGGMWIHGAAAVANQLIGDEIGVKDEVVVDVVGNGTGMPGLTIGPGAPATIIGGPIPKLLQPYASVVTTIGGNDGAGIVFDRTTGARLSNTFVGTNVNGDKAAPNGGDGIVITGTADQPSTGNLIEASVSSANDGNGVVLGDHADRNIIRSSRFGAGAPPPNGKSAILIDGGNSNVIGSTDATLGNQILNHPEDGVTITAGSGNAIIGNRIHGNVDRSIDLNDDGPTANDSGDLDTGPNGLQNTPVIATVTDSTPPGQGFTIAGTLDSKPKTKYRIEVFATSCPFGNESPEVFSGAVIVATDATGSAAFKIKVPPNVPGEFVTTATGPEGTSEASHCVVAS